MLFRSPVVRFFSRILNRVTITVVLVALQLLWLCARMRTAPTRWAGSR